MKEKELKELAKKIQLEIKEEQLPIYLETFTYLEKLLANFKKVKLSTRAKPMKRINVGYLTLPELEKISKGFSKKRVSKKTLKDNSAVSEDNFILFSNK